MDKELIKWRKAEARLNALIAEYSLLGPAGGIALNLTLLPLKLRLNSGEHSESLYKEIMKLC